MVARILFACSECETALIWPVDSQPQCSDRLVAVNDGSFAEARDCDGNPVYVVHPESNWRLVLDGGGEVRCPQGHNVGATVELVPARPAYLALRCDRVVERKMRGRV